jgi:hypothetical protein
LNKGIRTDFARGAAGYERVGHLCQELGSSSTVVFRPALTVVQHILLHADVNVLGPAGHLFSAYPTDAGDLSHLCLFRYFLNYLRHLLAACARVAFVDYDHRRLAVTPRQRHTSVTAPSGVVSDLIPSAWRALSPAGVRA